MCRYTYIYLATMLLFFLLYRVMCFAHISLPNKIECNIEKCEDNVYIYSHGHTGHKTYFITSITIVSYCYNCLQNPRVSQYYYAKISMSCLYHDIPFPILGSSHYPYGESPQGMQRAK